MRHFALVLILVVTACRSSQKGAASPDDGQGSRPVAKFHDILAPIWHSPAGPDRVEKACAAVPSMQKRAKAIVASAPGAEPPERLAEAVDLLGTECAGNRADFETKLADVHDLFHSVMEAQ